MFGPCFAIRNFKHLSRFSIILMGKRALVDLLWMSSWCLVTAIVVWLFLTVPWVDLQYVIVVVFPYRTQLLF